MKSSDCFPSPFLRAEDFTQDEDVIIQSVEMTTMKSKDGKTEEKVLMKFRGLDAGLIVNKTNWNAVAKQHGDESESWVGKKITLTVMYVEFGADLVSAIRVKSPKLPPVPLKRVESPAPILDEAGEVDHVTPFWLEAKRQGLDRKSALAILANHKDNFVTALAALKNGDEIPF